MGSESSSSGASGVEDAEVQRRKKERQRGFDTYNQQQASSRRSERETGMALPVSRPTPAVRSNISLAMDLEDRANNEDFTGQRRGNSVLNMREAMFPMGRALSFAIDVSDKIRSADKFIWFLDQNALWKTYNNWKDKLNFYKFERHAMDWEFKYGTMLWTGKGPRKYDNKLYVEQKDKYTKDFYESCNI